MFNSSIAAHELLTRRSDSGILKSYSLEACFAMCQNVTEGVEKAPEGTVQTMSHLNFALEVIGYSFCLPVESRSIGIIKRAICIYDSWLLSCPKCALPTEQNLMRDILGHFTLLFHNKSSASYTQAHTELAFSVIEVTRKFISSRCDDIDAVTWTYAVRLMLGCADCVFEGPVLSAENFSGNVSVQLSRLIFEIYIRSLPVAGMNEDTWQLLDRFFPRWTHRLSIIHQWNDLCMCLTTQLLVMLPREACSPTSKDVGGLSCIISFPQRWSSSQCGKSEFRLSSVHLKYCWFRILQCIGNPNNVSRNRPEADRLRTDRVLSEAMGGICAIADTILSHSFWNSTLTDNVLSPEVCVDLVCNDMVEILTAAPTHAAADLRTVTDTPQGAEWNPPFSNVTANSVIALLGRWLFEAALKRDSAGDVDVEDSRALATAALGRIFSSKYMTGNNGQTHAALHHHKSRYFLCLKYALDTSSSGFSKKVLATVLLTSWRVMSAPLRGSELLLMDYLSAINEVVSVCNIDAQPIAIKHKLTQPASGPVSVDTDVCSYDSDKLRATPTSATVDKKEHTPTHSVTYGGIDLAELRRACVVILMGIINRQRHHEEGGPSDSARNNGRPSAMSLLLKLLQSEQNVRNIQLVAVSLPCLPVHSPLWSSRDRASRVELILCILGCLKTHVDFGMLMSCVKSLGHLSATHAQGDVQLSCDVLEALCQFIRNMLDQMSLSIGATSMQGESAAQSQPPPSLSRAQSSRRVHNVYKGPTVKGAISPSPNGEPSPSKLDMLRLMDVSFQAILDWLLDVMCCEYLQSFGWVMHDIHSTSISYITSVSKQGMISSLPDHAVYRLLDFVLHKCGRFPGKTGTLGSWAAGIFCDHAQRQGCWATGLPSMSHLDDCRCDDINQSFLHFLVDDDVILSVFDPSGICADEIEMKHNHVGNDTLVVIMRSKFGLHVHEMSSLMSTCPAIFDPNDTRCSASPDHCDNVYQADADGLDVAFRMCNDRSDLLLPMQRLNSIMNGSNTPEHIWTYCGSHQTAALSISSLERNITSSLDLLAPLYCPFTLRLQKQRDIEARAAQEDNVLSHGGVIDDTQSSRSIKLSVAVRQILSQLRFAGLHSQNQLAKLENTVSLREKIAALDDSPCTEQYEAWCVFVANKNDCQSERVVVHTGPLAHTQLYCWHYVNFLLAMGWLVDLDIHQGYTGGIDPVKYSGKILYYANAYEEIVFHQHVWGMSSRHESHFSSTTPLSELPMNRSLTVSGGPIPPVIVIWNRCSQQIYPNSPLWSEYGGIRAGKHLTIFIDPLVEVKEQGLYRIRTHVPSTSIYRSPHSALGQQPFGPLVDGLVVSLDTLPGLIRRVIVDVHRSCRYQSHPADASGEDSISPQVARQRIISHIRSENISPQNTVSLLAGTLFK